MKQIQTIEDKERKDRRNKIIIGIILVLVLVMSTAGFAFFSGERGTEKNKPKIKQYNGIDFTEINGQWIFILGGIEFITQHHPSETEDIKVPLVEITQYNGRPLYIASVESDGVNELARNMARFVERIQFACLEGMECEGNLPIKNCESNVIAIREANKTEIEKDGNCVFIYASANDTIRAADAFLFRVFGLR